MNEEMVAIYPGTFDPWTVGHQDVLETATRLFDRVVVCCMTNRSKAPVFDIEARMTMINDAISDCIDTLPFIAQRADASSNLHAPAVHVASDNNARWIVRGLRLGSEYEHELASCLINAALDSTVRTVYLPPRQGHIHVSSSAVRELLSLSLVDEACTMVPKCNWPLLRSIWASGELFP